MCQFYFNNGNSRLSSYSTGSMESSTPSSVEMTCIYALTQSFGQLQSDASERTRHQL